MLLAGALILFLSTDISHAAVTEKDLEQQLGFDVKGMKKVSLTDYVNGAKGGFSAGFICESNGTLGQCCYECDSSTQKKHPLTLCKKDLNLRCNIDTCDCRPGYYSVKGGTGCQLRTKKELGETCNKDKDDCYAAFAECRNNKCQCWEGLTAGKGICKPPEPNCPLGTPLKVNGTVTVCDDKNKSCPSGYSCLLASDDLVGSDFPGTIFYDRNGAQQSYCCQNLPSLTPEDAAKTNILNICRYGKKYTSPKESDDDGTFVQSLSPTECSNKGFSTDKFLDTVCCQSICISGAEAYVIDGKCTYVSPLGWLTGNH